MNDGQQQRYLSPAGRTLITDGGRRTQKPFGPFEDFDDCVETLLADDDDLEREEAENICGAMEENPDDFFSSLADKAQAILSNLKVTFVSGVDTPAQDSEMLLMKSADADVQDLLDDADWSRTERELLVKQSDDEREEQKTWAPALIPGEVDKQGDVVPVKEIESAAHEFLKEYGNIDLEHELLSGKGQPIESWTLKDDRTFEKFDGTESREYPEGTWMLGVEWSDEAWEAIKDGDITGLSIFGEAAALNPDAIQEIAAGHDSRASTKAMVKALRYASKAISAEDHEAVSEAISAFLDQFDTGEDRPPVLAELSDWLDDNSGEAVEAAAEHLARFRDETNAPEDALVEEFIGWLAEELEEGQSSEDDEEGDEQSASVNRRSLFRSATAMETTAKSMASDDPLAEAEAELERVSKQLDT